LEQSRWDAVVIDESHNLISRGSQRNELARLLAAQTDALILASATPHNGDTRSFAELIRLLDPTAIADPKAYSIDDITHLYTRRTKVSPEVRDETGAQWADRGPSIPVRCTAGPAEDAVLAEITSTWLSPGGPPTSTGNRLFPFVLLKSFLSSPPALLHTIDQRLDHQDLPVRERTALRRLRTLTEAVGESSAKLDALVRELRDLGVGPKSDTRVVVFSERVQTLEWLRRELPARLGFTKATAEKAAKVMHGGISDLDQQKLVEEFSLTAGALRILITGDVASEGVNLHRACHHLVHFDVPWSLIRIEQRNGRIDRYGQTKPPQFRALLLVASNAGPDDDLYAPGTLRDDRIVAEKLLAKEEEVHRTLGTVEAVTGQYLPEKEERRLMRDLLNGRTTEQSLEHHPTDSGGQDDDGQDGSDQDDDEPADFSLLDELSGPVGDRPDAPPSLIEVPSLFAGTQEFLDEALHEVFARPAEALDLKQEGPALSLDAPDDLRQRLSDLPRSYLDTLRTGTDRRLRLHLTFDRAEAQKSLDRARASRTTLWPTTHYLGELHPVIDWLIDRVLLKLGRQQAPVLLAGVCSPAFLLQGVYCNALGQPTVVEWMAVTGLPGDAELRPMIDVLREAGVGPRMPNPAQSLDLTPLQAQVPDAVTAASTYLEARRGEYDAMIAEPLRQLRERTDRYEQLGLDLMPGTRTTVRETVRTTALQQRTLADELETTGDPLLRLLAVLAPLNVGGAR
ncbi:MAG: hypothetical protein QG671_2172, partial [Actinomycetota bacterium]|nr:hypothetical protein [Actinomycetota bacterium]